MNMPRSKVALRILAIILSTALPGIPTAGQERGVRQVSRAAFEPLLANRIEAFRATLPPAERDRRIALCVCRPGHHRCQERKRQREQRMAETDHLQ